MFYSANLHFFKGKNKRSLHFFKGKNKRLLHFFKGKTRGCYIFSREKIRGYYSEIFGVTLTRRCRRSQCGEKTSYSPQKCGEYLDFSPQMANFACRQALLSLIEGLYVCVIVTPIANISGSGRNGPDLSGMRSGCWGRSAS